MIRRTKFLLVLLCFLTIFVLISVSRTQTPVRLNDSVSVRKPHVPEKFILLHLDLKGAPPKINFLLELLPLARRAGANGLLIEYEDSYPWSGALRNVSAGNAYTRDELKALVKLATDLRMEVIPLVQTFGHLEFVLKLQEFRHLRELDTFPQELCPSKPESYQLIKEMIHQIMDLHKNARYLHIGCDEVYHIAGCPVCSKHNQRICLDEITLTHDVVITANCGHLYHRLCYEPWIKANSTCPTCRTKQKREAIQVYFTTEEDAVESPADAVIEQLEQRCEAMGSKYGVMENELNIFREQNQAANIRMSTLENKIYVQTERASDLSTASKRLKAKVKRLREKNVKLKALNRLLIADSEARRETREKN